MKSVLLDTFPIVKFFKNEPGAEKIEKILGKIERKEIKGFISSITISEFFYIFARFKNEDFAKAIIKHIRGSNLKIISLDDKIAEIGGSFKFKYVGKGKKGLPIADALIAATSFVNNMILICDEEDYFKIKEIKVKTPNQFVSQN
ncbi:MAG: PIN domain-containing protein [Candidatus Aenigmarchaeota archaeon]|nr:PIN domain-containing protein [Candidatus Aenigmarchaeota archaeon]